MTEESSYIYGRNSLLEALKNNAGIQKIYFMYGIEGPAIMNIRRLAGREKIQCVVYDKRKFIELENKVCPKNAKAQGVIALVELIDTLSVKDLIAQSFKISRVPILVALDEIQDPHNLGAIARSAECFGAAGLILSERNTVPVTPAAVKASAGALEHLPVSVTNLSQALLQCRNSGFWITGADGSGTKNIYEYDFAQPHVIVIGSEGKGMRDNIKKQCDEILKIPITGKVSSLNASVSSGIFLYEILRQRNHSAK